MPAIRRTKKDKQSFPPNPEVKRWNYPFSFCEKGFDYWEFSNKAVLLICNSRAQGLLQYEFELIQLLIVEQIAKIKLVGKQIIYYWANYPTNSRSNLSHSNRKYSCFHTAVAKK